MGIRTPERAFVESPAMCSPAATPADAAAPVSRRPVEAWSRAAIGPGLVLLFALVWRLLGITATDVWADEAVTLMLARAPLRDLLLKLPTAEGNPPLFFVPFKAWGLVAQSDWAMRLLPCVLGVGVVGVLMGTAHSIRKGAWLPTGLLAAVSPAPVHYSQEIRGYSLLLLATAVTLWAAWRARTPTRGRTLAMTLAAAAAAHVHAVGLFVYPMGAALLLVIGRRAAIRAILRPWGAWLWLVLVAPMLWFNMHWSQVHRADWWIPPVSWSQLRTLGAQVLGLHIVESWEYSRWPERMWAAFVIERLMILAPVVLLSAGLADRATRRTTLGLAAAAATYLALMIAAGILSVPNLALRTVLPAVAPLLLMLGLGGSTGATTFLRSVARTAVVALCVLQAGAWAWYVAAGPPRRPPGRATYAWMRAGLGPHDLVVTTPMWIEDLTAWYLGDLVPAERLLGAAHPILDGGSPPVRRVIPLVHDEGWRERLREAIRRAAERSGGRYSVWYVQFAMLSPPDRGNIPAVLSEEHEAAAVFVAPGDMKTVHALRYVPRKVSSAPSPLLDPSSAPFHSP